MIEVPFLDLKKSYAAISEDADVAMKRIASSAAFIGGAEVISFEEEFANYCDAAYCAGVDNGTSALRLILKALGISRGDEVVVPANTFAASAEAVCHVGATPVFVDVCSDMTLDPNLLEEVVTPNTKCIIAVHLYGQPADMDAINAIAKSKGICVIEDAAQAHGARYKGRRVGTLGTAAAFSFYPGKNLGAFGDGGAVTSNDPDLIHRVKMLREHGQSRKYFHELVGETARLDALQAAILRIKLRTLDENNERRNSVAQQYCAAFNGFEGIQMPIVKEHNNCVWHLFVAACDHRDKFIDYLSGNSISCGLHYPIPLVNQPAFQEYESASKEFPNTVAHANRLVSLPIFPEMEHDQIEHVMQCVTRYFS